MPEEFETGSAAEIDWKKYWALALRRRWFFLVPFFAVWAAVWAVSWFVPSVYRSGTLILVEKPNNPVVTTNPSEDIQGRLETITQQVLSRTNLLRIINNLNLYSKERSHGATDDDLVEQTRKKVEIELVHTADNSGSRPNLPMC